MIKSLHLNKIHEPVYNGSSARYAAIMALDLKYDETRFNIGEPDSRFECQSDFAWYCVELAACVEAYRPILQALGNFYPVNAVEEIADQLNNWDSENTLPAPMDLARPVILSQFESSN